MVVSGSANLSVVKEQQVDIGSKTAGNLNDIKTILNKRFYGLVIQEQIGSEQICLIFCRVCDIKEFKFHKAFLRFTERAVERGMA